MGKGTKSVNLTFSGSSFPRVRSAEDTLKPQRPPYLWGFSFTGIKLFHLTKAVVDSGKNLIKKKSNSMSDVPRDVLLPSRPRIQRISDIQRKNRCHFKLSQGFLAYYPKSKTESNHPRYGSLVKRMRSYPEMDSYLPLYL